MNNNYNQDSFNKGQAFEDYVEQILFPASHYELLHKTNSFDQNSQRYVGDSRKPDFRFKCILTDFEFHIEAKYRSKPFQGHYDILSAGQVETFPEIHKEECPVYIALGYGGLADDPAYVSLVPYAEYRSSKILIEDAVLHQIQKQVVDSTIFSKPAQEIIEAEEVSEVFTNQTVDSQKPKGHIENEVISKSKNPNSFIFGSLLILLIGLLAIVYYVPIGENDATEKAMRERIKNYYAMSDANNLQELKSYISPEITYWYGTENPTIAEVIDNIKEYRNANPFSESSVGWDTFSLTTKEGGGYFATYPLEYKVKAKLNAPYRSYDLKLLTTWDEEMRLISITEIRRQGDNLDLK